LKVEQDCELSPCQCPFGASDLLMANLIDPASAADDELSEQPLQLYFPAREA
jgi:hypothetical protein